MLAPYKGTDVGATPTGTTTMKYLHKLVEINYEGKPKIGFVIDEFENFYGEIKVRILLQRTERIVSFDTNFCKLKLLEE